MNNGNLYFIDEVALKRLEFLERLIEKDPSNVRLIDVYQKLIESMFALETQYVLSDQAIIEKEMELDNFNEESTLERMVKNV